jgi:hypothetical protein
MMLHSRPARVALIVIALVVVGVIVAALAQPKPPIAIAPGGAAAGGAVAVNCLEVIREAGAVRYIAAGTSQGLRVYEVRQIGAKFTVKDVTQD